MGFKQITLTTIISCLVICSRGQDKYFTKSGKIQFVANDDRDVNASSHSGVATLDIKSGEFNFSVLVKSFEFQKALMQEKFNHTVLQTDQFPKAEFKGSLETPSSVNYQKDGSYPVRIKGKMNLHGVIKEITAGGTITISKEKIIAASTFIVSINDYNISNPGIGDGNITISVECTLLTGGF